MKKSTLTASNLHHVNPSMWLTSRWLRAFLSSILKNLAFTLSKPIFITYNTPHYNTTYNKTFIFLPFHLNNVSLLFFNNFLFFLSLLYLSLLTAPLAPTYQPPTQNPPPIPQSPLTKKEKEKSQQKETSTSNHNHHIHPHSLLATAGHHHKKKNDK